MRISLSQVRILALAAIIALLSTSHPAPANASESQGDYCKDGSGYCVYQTSLFGSYAAGGKVCTSDDDPYCTTCPSDPIQVCGVFGQNIAYHRTS